MNYNDTLTKIHNDVRDVRHSITSKIVKEAVGEEYEHYSENVMWFEVMELKKHSCVVMSSFFKMTIYILNGKSTGYNVIMTPRIEITSANLKKDLKTHMKEFVEESKLAEKLIEATIDNMKHIAQEAQKIYDTEMS